ncbi:DUF4232 domain-containing protein [Streptomyces sp. Z26]|uniref:DUF4232 domain-containing protein n=1 Tax=Streptomyces TaxID=1883 RepID=UPI000EF13410|nr:DUF4232 domain-containing protein [Streptomyces sp. Z26]RLL70209.1 DUF4232 domain-containing protein [Streptomyces sp. Z26]
MRARMSSRPARLVLAAVAGLALAGGAAVTATAASGGASGGVEPTCGTNDLDFSVSEKSQAGGYYQITAKAKPGVTCWLEGVYPSASFGSSADSEVSPAQQAVSDSVRLTGDTEAYAGINPKPVNEDGGLQYDFLHLSLLGDTTHSVTLELPSTATVIDPIATNWHADASDAVPFPN